MSKGLGNIHPLVTLAGIVPRVPVFGVFSLVIGPLLGSCFIVLMGVIEGENKQQEMSLHGPGLRRPLRREA